MAGLLRPPKELVIVIPSFRDGRLIPLKAIFKTLVMCSRNTNSPGIGHTAHEDSKAIAISETSCAGEEDDK